MKNILCYGDSNTYGLKSDLVSRYERHERWTGILQERLGSGYYVIEEGLGGRTTVWDDPVEEHKNGKTYLLPCLESHKPLDLVILMLGTNDLKLRFSVSSFDVGTAMENLVKTILKSEAGRNQNAPEILLITPVPIRSVGNPDLDRMLHGAVRKSHELAPYYERIARQYRIHYLNPEGQVELNDQDGIHYTLKGHQEMAALIQKKICEIFPEEI
ncbi:SGNH/GDSL hydrolase family protein [Diplocloster agilis]|uniref:SGNH/GDSL hydrolase family protein n=2 Tax=Diplocloster agilis TaxID=2850323 RepID=A0A949K827_9FIRM|nr:SGNH/GDSL hydrolase family protein [Diplocloster agilis]MBU9738493.1 SGNH/GDSL hydrolase family protein [Diplocloster agilis]MBU9743432.1 SGNH/GDSL hydrolase family protein [Diplocloster agilis]